MHKGLPDCSDKGLPECTEKGLPDCSDKGLPECTEKGLPVCTDRVLFDSILKTCPAGLCQSTQAVMCHLLDIIRTDVWNLEECYHLCHGML